MPSQTSAAPTVYYVEFDTAPPLRACLKDGENKPIDLTGATVTITVAFTMPRQDYYTSPRDQIVVRSPVTVDPDQVANKGYVSWTPGAQGDDDALTPPGDFLYNFEVIYQDGTKQTIPPISYQTMHIQTPVGGRSLNLP
jgi:hypothetical protein